MPLRHMKPAFQVSHERSSPAAHPPLPASRPCVPLHALTHPAPTTRSPPPRPQIATVDKYQGAQNDYILLSLVRSRAVGHLRDVRRLVVAMSRARLGLYVFGRRWGRVQVGWACACALVRHVGIGAGGGGSGVLWRGCTWLGASGCGTQLGYA